MSGLWSDDEESALRKLLAQGLSASQIGARLRCSRQAVIGKTHRLGLRLARARGAKLEPNRPVQRRAKSVRRGPVASSKLKPSAPELPPHVPYVPREPAPILPSTSFEDRKPGQCAWPVSTDKPFRYCGSERQPGKRRSGKTREYCQAHERMYVASEAWL